MVAIDEIGRRLLGRVSDRLQSLPILALNVHTACNCRCVMCDIWKANSEKRHIGSAELDRHVDGIRRMRVQRVMLTGGEPLLHTNLWALCDRLRAAGVRITLVTTGLLIESRATDIARAIDEVVVSVDGPPDMHDQIRRVHGGFDRIGRGLQALAQQPSRPRIIARSVVQQANYAVLAETVRATHELGADRVSFLGADVSSTAFNRPEPWNAQRQSEVAVRADQLDELAASIRRAEHECRDLLDTGFVVGGRAALWRLRDYYAALAGVGRFPHVRCNAPWVSAVLEPGGILRPCFFHQPYQGAIPREIREIKGKDDLINREIREIREGVTQSFDEVLNSPSACEFRRNLDVRTNEICQRCVCSLSLPVWAEV